MKPGTVILISQLVLVAVVFQFVPLLTRQGIFFGATVASGFPQSSNGRRLLRSYRLQAAGWAVLAFVLAFMPVSLRPEYRILAPTLLLVAGCGVSYWLKFREVHARYGELRPEIRQAQLSADAGGAGFRAWVWVPPFLALAATGAYLYLHWNQLPERFPVHWGADGQPNRWSSRDALGVYGPVLMGAGMNAFMLAFGWLLSRLSRNTVMRRTTVRILEFMLYPLTFAFVIVALLPLGLVVPLWMVPGVMLVFVAVMIYWSYRQIAVHATVDAVPDPQSDAYWKAGMFYYNPNDPAVFVAKRVGIGYTMNFASKWAWVVMALTLGIIVGSIVLGKNAAS